MKILICGGRDFPQEKVVNWMEENKPQFIIEGEDVLVISGGARGADTGAELWAKLAGYKNDIYRANWNKYGPAAGHIRNRQMAEEGKPDLVIAFPGGKGTEGMIEIAKELGIPVRKVLT